MSVRTVLALGVYATFIALASTVGSWGLPLAAAPFADVEAPAAQSSTERIAAGPARDVAAGTLPVQSTQLQRRTAAAGLSPTLESLMRAVNGPAWAAWTVPSVPGTERGRNRHGSSQRVEASCVLDDDGAIRENRTDDDTTMLVVLARFTNGDIDRVTFTDARCTVQAGNRPVYWLDDVRPADSVGVLADLVRRAPEPSGGSRRLDAHGGALAAIALTDDPSADAALEASVASTSPRAIRRDAAFWLGAARGAAGAKVIDRLARTDEDSEFREHLTFVLTLTGEAGVDRLIDLARHDSASGVRKQALFWLSQKAGERAVGTLTQAADGDPDVDVRKQAVFALSQLPKDEGVPKLIALAQTHRDPEVRQQAMFWLGQSGDPRALSLFEQLLKH